MWLRKSSRALLIAAGELGKGGEVARGVRRVRAPARAQARPRLTGRHGKATRGIKTNARGSRRRGRRADERRKKTSARKTTMHRSALFRSLARLSGEENEGGSGPEGRRRRGGLLDINGEARGGRGSDADDHSG